LHDAVGAITKIPVPIQDGIATGVNGGSIELTASGGTPFVGLAVN